MKRLSVLLTVTILVAAGPVLAQSEADREAIERAVLDYVEGIYEQRVELQTLDESSRR